MAKKRERINDKNPLYGIPQEVIDVIGAEEVERIEARVNAVGESTKLLLEKNPFEEFRRERPGERSVITAPARRALIQIDEIGRWTTETPYDPVVIANSSEAARTNAPVLTEALSPQIDELTSFVPENKARLEQINKELEPSEPGQTVTLSSSRVREILVDLKQIASELPSETTLGELKVLLDYAGLVRGIDEFTEGYRKRPDLITKSSQDRVDGSRPQKGEGYPDELVAKLIIAGGGTPEIEEAHRLSYDQLRVDTELILSAMSLRDDGSEAYSIVRDILPLTAEAEITSVFKLLQGLKAANMAKAGKSEPGQVEGEYLTLPQALIGERYVVAQAKVVRSACRKLDIDPKELCKDVASLLDASLEARVRAETERRLGSRAVIPAMESLEGLEPNKDFQRACKEAYMAIRGGAGISKNQAKQVHDLTFGRDGRQLECAESGLIVAAANGIKLKGLPSLLGRFENARIVSDPQVELLRSKAEGQYGHIAGFNVEALRTTVEKLYAILHDGSDSSRVLTALDRDNEAFDAAKKEIDDLYKILSSPEEQPVEDEQLQPAEQLSISG